jgi:hypothetical protein
MIKTKLLTLICTLAILFSTQALRAEDLAAAIAAGKVSATFRGTGGSSGDTIMVTVKKTHARDGNITLTIPAGTRLNSKNSGEQNMVISGVNGLMEGESAYSPTSIIEASSSPQTYVLDAYCAEFEKDNPSQGSGFSLDTVDTVSACIFSKATDLSSAAKQAAVWIHTDKASFEQVNYKFRVSKSEWKSAESIVRKCQKK